MLSLDLNSLYLSVDDVDYFGSDIMDRAKLLNDNVIECIIYDKTPQSILTIMGCVLLKKPFLILDKKWPLSYQNQLMHLIQYVQVENDSFFIATSGSTGAPKLCSHFIESLLTSARRSMAHQPIGDTESIVLSLSPAHMGGLLAITKSILSGATLRLDSSDWLAAVHEFDMHFMIVPQQIPKLLGLIQSSIPKSAIKSVLIGGDSIPVHLRHELFQLGIPAIFSYGLTETCGQITATFPHSLALHSGFSLPDVKLKVINGSMAIKVSTLARGYLSVDGFVPLPLSDGWFLTSDLAKIDDDGSITILGRIDYQFNSGSELISPEFVESVLLDSKLMDFVIVVPKSDDRFGYIPVAFIKDQSDIDALVQFSEDHLPLFMRPKHWVIIPSRFDLYSKSLRKECIDYVQGLKL